MVCLKPMEHKVSIFDPIIRFSRWEMDHFGWHPSLPRVFLDLPGPDPLDSELRNLSPAPQRRWKQSGDHSQLGIELCGLASIPSGDNDSPRTSSYFRIHLSLLHRYMVLRLPTTSRDKRAHNRKHSCRVVSQCRIEAPT